MIISDLMSDLEVIGGKETFSNRGLLIQATNYALRRLYSDRTIVKTVRLATRRPEPIAYYKEIHSQNGDMIEFPLNGTSYSMRIHGNCKYMITDGGVNTVRSVDSKNEAVLIRGFISYGGTISFWGSFAFTVYDFAIYDEFYSEKPQDIPDYGSKRIFDLREIYGDFMAFTAPATDFQGNPIKSCRLYDGKVEVDYDYVGEIVLTYRRMPTKIYSIQDNITVIDVPKDYELILILLIAYYYLFFQGNEGADKFLNEYEKAIQNLTENGYQGIENKYVDTTGWA